MKRYFLATAAVLGLSAGSALARLSLLDHDFENLVPGRPR
jgi:hypothetical protein